MIFRDWRAILNGTKTSDLRLVKANSAVVTHNGVITEVIDGSIKKRTATYIVGKTYAVQPASGMPTIYYMEQDGKRISADQIRDQDTGRYVTEVAAEYRQARGSALEYHWIMQTGWNLRPLYIRITSIEKTMLYAFYAWRLTFELVKE